MMNENSFGGSICMLPEVKHKEYDPTLQEEDYDPMLYEEYPHSMPHVYLEGWIEMYGPLSEDAVVLARDKQIIKYIKSERREFLAETEAGETIWVSGSTEYGEDCLNWRYLGNSRTTCEYAVEEYDIGTSKKRRYKVVLDEESEMTSIDYYLLSHSVDGETLGSHFEIVDGVLFKCFSRKENIVIPEGVTKIANCAFEYCRPFKSVVLPSTVTKIPCAFCNTEQLEIAEDNPKYYVQDGCLIDKEEKELVWAFAGSTIPDDGSVVKIGSDAFRHRYDLSRIVIPDVITGIGDDAFIGCGYVEEIILPEHFVEDSQRIFGRTLIKDGDKWIFEARNFSGFSF